jgi:NAD(P)H-dependent FMN reductase
VSVNDKVKILAISGSLRADSSNNAVISAAKEMEHGQFEISVYKGLGSLPPFDDSKTPSPSVADLRQQIARADAVLVCSPEYAFGVPGILKNAIDWTVSSGEFVNKPVGIITAATSGDKAHASLLLTFSALSASIPEGGSLLLSFIRSKINPQGRINDTDTLRKIEAAITALVAKAQNLKR